VSWDRARLGGLVEALRAKLGEGAVSTEAERLAPYGRDESDTGEFPPDVLVLPSDAEQVSAVFALCQAHGVPFTPVGARSGKSGGSLPLEGGVSVSLERMNRVLEISTEDLTAVVQPGVVTGDLMRAVEAVGLFYPPDPNSHDWCTLGGNVAENAGGPRALKYGVTREYVLGMEWVLPSGERLRVGKRTLKGVAGYDLVGLFVGSEGTLGVATEITLQLLPLPRHVVTALCCFPDVHAAARGLAAVLAGGMLPRTLELLDDLSVQAVARQGVAFPAGTGAAVLLEVDGNHEEPLFEELGRAGEVLTAHGALETVVARDGAQRERLWAARRVLSTALRSMRPFKISEDICVPRSRIPEAVARLKALGDALGLTVVTYGHAGDGNLHANILYDAPSDRPRVEEGIRRMLQLTVELGGTITGEHGVGLAKRDYLPLEQPEGLIRLQRGIKQLLDPAGLLNPGKIFPPTAG
jgi:glycolate oxidase